MPTNANCWSLKHARSASCILTLRDNSDLVSPPGPGGLYPSTYCVCMPNRLFRLIDSQLCTRFGLPRLSGPRNRDTTECRLLIVMRLLRGMWSPIGQCFGRTWLITKWCLRCSQFLMLAVLTLPASTTLLRDALHAQRTRVFPNDVPVFGTCSQKSGVVLRDSNGDDVSIGAIRAFTG